MELNLLLSASVPRYGENFRQLRGAESQETIAKRLRLKRQANVSAIEVSDKVPSPKTILKHAKALGRKPSELLKGVETDYDRIRSGAWDAAEPAATRTKKRAS